MSAKFRLGLLINPYAGIGGSVALKGSDGADIRHQALAKGAKPQAQLRAEQALQLLLPYKDQLEIFTAAGEMGLALCQSLGLNASAIYHPQQIPTEASDTQAAVQRMLDNEIDLLLFAGGDGTARDICAVVEAEPDKAITVLGIPAGCKIHSGVYCVTPAAAGRVVEDLLTGKAVSLMDADVMDIDEQAFREGRVRARRFGEMTIPAKLQYVQSVKIGGQESDELVLDDIADHVIEQLEPEDLCLMGSGSTVAAVMARMGVVNTLLGVDVVQDQALLANDQTAEQLLAQVAKHNDPERVKLVITLIGGQGHLFGRGNQQLSPALLKQIKRQNILLVASKAKLSALNGRPLIVDTGDADLNRQLCGSIAVITGYHDKVLYRIASPA
ncbi:ATP-NAD kinase [Corallincola luteus]|uniref:ATP-NAD kinase n=1 Tax=Corallincola luteus TaxID=1775177 RepID=A0ABY2AJS5_9GAMM|nr:ATP-NAD kinase family protein [Corallincola luteus]TCI03057.1 ATP-NAD kinase [Corallincola luteus]